jgi:hypothetical protein
MLARSLPASGLRLFLALLVTMFVFGAMDEAKASAACGVIDGEFRVKVSKGEISCTTARATATKFRDKRSCGTSMVGACAVDAFHCRVASAGETSAKHLAGYCYVLKRSVPAAKDLSFFTLSKFKKAIAILIPSSSSRRVGEPPSRRLRASLKLFQTPSHNIACALSHDFGARCDIKAHSWKNPPKPPDCPTDWGSSVSVGRSGRAHINCHGDTTFGPNPVLAYGERLSLGPFSCLSRFSGVRCVNRRTGHGFALSRNHLRRF